MAETRKFSGSGRLGVAEPTIVSFPGPGFLWGRNGRIKEAGDSHGKGLEDGLALYCSVSLKSRKEL